jgi:lysyl-tRNA synthetase class 2
MSTWQELANNQRLKKIYEERLAITKSVREFFWQRGFVEAETPLAMRFPGQEPYLNPVPVDLFDAVEKKLQTHLRTSPEFSLKKLLASGYGKIFEIGKCFRNQEDTGGTHNPEFTMLEWYRLPGELSEIMDDTEELFKNALHTIEKKELQYRGNKILIDDRWDRMTMKEIFKKYLQINLDEYLETEKISELAGRLGYKFDVGEEYENIFFKIFLNEIEPKLGIKKPIFVYDYPARMCSLSRLSSDPRYAERFELYVGGLEVANAFGELVDPVDQEKRLKADLELRKKMGKETWPVDADFIGALSEIHKKGDRASGIALGLDRMVVLCTGAKDINEVIFNNLADQFNNN